jgi:ATP-dependent protease ClpP protease subunit
MPSWNEIVNEINTSPSKFAYDETRQKYIKKLTEKTDRNVIAYYSGWLQNPNASETSISDVDKNSLMATVHGLDRDKGLDLILHTPGGQTAAAESIVDYLHTMFNNDIRAIVPQLAMSAGTMIACACKEIIMGKHSSLGPIDPQFNGIPATGVIEEFQRAYEEIKADPAKGPVWQVIISKYHPTFLGECQKAIEWSKKIVEDWLRECMFEGDGENVDTIVNALADHSEMKSHSRHISMEQCKQIGLKIVELEADQDLQDIVLSIHHTYMYTLSSNQGIVKIVENQNDMRVVERINVN